MTGAAFESGDRVTVAVSDVVDPPDLCREPRVVVCGVIGDVMPCYWLAFPNGRPAAPWPLPGHRLTAGWRP